MVLSVNSTAEDWILKTQAPHVHKILYWRIPCIPFWYNIHDSETLLTGLLESPKPESRNLACWHASEGDQWPCGEPPAYSGIHPSYRSSCFSEQHGPKKKKKKVQCNLFTLCLCLVVHGILLKCARFHSVSVVPLQWNIANPDASNLVSSVFGRNSMYSLSVWKICLTNPEVQTRHQ